MILPFLDGLGDILFPRNCILCHQYLQDRLTPQLCSRCVAGIECNTPPFCLRCSRHLDIYTMEGLCPTCLKYPIEFDCAWGAINYNPTAQKLLHLFKYQQKTSVRKIFGPLLSNFLNTYQIPLNSFDYLTAVPLHSVRYRERGFNQSQLIAHHLHIQTGIPLLTDALIRTRPTQAQAFLDQKERWTNLQGAFRMNHNFDIKNKSILIIDDLLTTGATASAAAAALKSAGAKKTGLLVVMLAP